MECSLTHKVDGLLVCSEDWKITNFTSIFQLTHHFSKTAVTGSTFRGLKFESGSNRLIRIHIGSINNLSVAFVIDISENTDEGEFLDFNATIRTITQKVVDRMKSSSTFKDWSSRSDDRQKRLVYVDDIVEFGNRLRDILLSHFKRHFNATVCKIVISEFGQDCRFENLGNMLSLFNLEFAEQVILHYAIDYNFDNSVLFFNREDIVTYLGKKNLRLEYFVALIRANGNFYFNMLHTLRPNTKVVEAKFYSEVFKEFHRGDHVRFMTPEISSMIFDPRCFSKGFCLQYNFNWQPHFQSIETLKNVLDSIGVSARNFYARYELIVSIEGDQIRRNAISIPDLVANNDLLNPSKISEFLRWIPIEQFASHLRKNLRPFVTTLESFVSERIQAECTRQFPIISPDNYLSCLAAEAVICFSLYGNTQYRNGRYLYPAWLNKALGLTARDYRDGQITACWPFPNITSGCVVKFEPIHFKLSWVLRLVARKAGIAAEIIGPLCELESFVYFHQNDANFLLQLEYSMEQLCSLLVHLLIDCVNYNLNVQLPRGYKKYTVRRKIIRLYEHQCPSRKEHMTTTEFINLVLRRIHPGFSFVYWIIDIVKYLLPMADAVMIMTDALRDHFEDLLFKEALFFYVRNDVINTTYVVLPVAGTSCISFGSLDLMRKNRLILQFKQAFEHAGITSSIAEVLSSCWQRQDKFCEVLRKILT